MVLIDEEVFDLDLEAFSWKLEIITHSQQQATVKSYLASLWILYSLYFVI